MTPKNLDELIEGDLDGSNTPDEAQRLARAIEQDPTLLERLEDERRARRNPASVAPGERRSGVVRSVLAAARRVLRLKG